MQTHEIESKCAFEERLPAPFCMLTVLVFMLAAATSAGTEEMNVPTSGRWKGCPIGMSVLTRIDEIYFKSKKETTRYRREVLIGEGNDGFVFLLLGYADESGRFLKTPSRSRQSGPMRRNPVAKRTRSEVARDGIQFGVVKTEFGRGRYEQFDYFKYTDTTLDGWDDIILESLREERDVYKELTHHRIYKQRLTKVTREEKFNRKLVVFEIELTDHTDGKLRRRSYSRLTPSIPKTLSYTGRWYDEAGQPVRETRGEVVMVDLTPDEVQKHNESRRNRLRNENLPIESEWGQWLLRQMKERGYSQEKALKEALQRMPDKATYESSYQRGYEAVSSGWQAYTTKREDKTRTDLFGAIEDKCGYPMTFWGPRAEVIALAMLEDSDKDIRRKGVIILARLMPWKYFSLLEKTMISQQSLDPAGLSALFAQGTGDSVHLCNVLAGVDKPLKEVSTRFLDSAPAAKAEQEVLRRIADLEGRRADESLFDMLCSFDSDEVRSYVADRVKGITKSDFIYPTRNWNLQELIGAACKLRVEGVEKLFLQWLNWVPIPSEGQEIDENTLLCAGVRARMVYDGLHLYEASVDKAIRELIEKLPDDHILYCLVLFRKRQEYSMLRRLELDLPAARIGNILQGEIATGWGMIKAMAFAPELIPSLCKSDRREVLSLFMKEAVVDYRSDVDYRQQALLSQKRWYQDRTGEKPITVKISCGREPFFTAMAHFGEDGSQILKNLYGWPSYRRYIHEQLRGYDLDRPYWIEQVTAAKEYSDDDEFLRELAILCLDSQGAAEKLVSMLGKYDSGWRVSDVRQAVAYLPQDELLKVVKARGLKGKDRYSILKGLSCHRIDACASLLLSALEDERSASGRVFIGSLMNRSAEKNFGLRKKEMRDWIMSLP